MSLLHRVIDLAQRAIKGVADVRLVVATDDVRVADHALGAGCPAVMTSPVISSGSARALAAARLLGEFDIVVSLQGDAPFQPVDGLAASVTAVREGADVATPVVRLGWEALDALRGNKLVTPTSGTTCARATDGRALWFSKAVIPAIRDEPRLRKTEPSPVWRHIGLYAYRIEALAAFDATPPSALERLEGLEQLRLIEMGLRIQAVAVEPSAIQMSGIDCEEDITRAEQLIAALGNRLGG